MSVHRKHKGFLPCGYHQGDTGALSGALCFLCPPTGVLLNGRHSSRGLHGPGTKLVL